MDCEQTPALFDWKPNWVGSFVSTPHHFPVGRNLARTRIADSPVSLKEAIPLARMPPFRVQHNLSPTYLPDLLITSSIVTGDCILTPTSSLLIQPTGELQHGIEQQDQGHGPLTQISKMIDHSLLHPTMTDQEILSGLETARRYNTATACVKPYSIPLASKILQGSDVAICPVIGFPAGNSTTEVKVLRSRTSG